MSPQHHIYPLLEGRAAFVPIQQGGMRCSDAMRRDAMILSGLSDDVGAHKLAALHLETALPSSIICM